MKKYLKNLGISASIIATVNTNIAMEAPVPKTGAITIVLDDVKYTTNDGSAKIKLVDKENSEESIINYLDVNFYKFTNNGKTIDGSAKKYLITKIEGNGVKYNTGNLTYTFNEGEPLKIHLKSKNYIKIQYTDWQRLQYEDEKKLFEAITNDISVIELFEAIKDNFKYKDLGKDLSKDLGTSNINSEKYNSIKNFQAIDGDEVIITIDSSKIADEHIRRCFVKPACSINLIKPDILNELNSAEFDFKNSVKTIGDLKTLLNNFKCNEDGEYKADGKQVITGPFKIKINGDGNEIPSTADKTDLTGANFIHLIVDKNTFNPYFLKKELKFDIEGGKDNYIISDEIKNKIQKSLNKLTNAEEVTQDAIFAELKKLEKDVFVEGVVVEKNIKCYKTGDNNAIKSNFGTDITVKIDPKAINPDKIKIKLTLGDIKNNENINLDPAVVTAINEKIKEVKFGISVKEILAILNNDELKSYVTETLVETDILDNTGNALTNNVSKNSTIKIKADKIKSEYFKKEKEKDNDETDQTGTENEVQTGTQTGDQKEKKGCCGGYGNKK